jgi:hypothetical protein
MPRITYLFGSSREIVEFMLATATPAEISDKVHRCLDLGFTTVCPPADVYPPARIENIEAFVRTFQEDQK